MIASAAALPPSAVVASASYEFNALSAGAHDTGFVKARFAAVSHPLRAGIALE